MEVDARDRERLLDLARRSILGSLAARRRLDPPAGESPGRLAERGASFVTLSIDGALRGCCGSIEPVRPLAEDVWRNAQRTAFQDPRFTPLRAEEAPQVLLEISVLTPLEPLPVASEQELLEVLRPGVDGLLLTCGAQRATFLPKVWRSLPEPRAFLAHLKRKMGVAEDFWDEALEIRRYQTQEFGDMLDVRSQPCAGS